VFNVVLGVCKPGGALTWTTVNAVPIGQPAGDGSAAVVASFHDVTEARRLDERIKASLREKEVLLKEIHHRVKNNLQIVSTLLDLQSDHTSDPRTLEMFRESRGRVKSMALIHERLYHSHDVAHVNFTEYVRQLADDLFYTYRVGDDIRLELAVDIPPLTIDIAIPCGLLLNELMSNCFKHAFRDAPEGCIRVSLSRAPDGWNVLTVADDGPGFPAGTDFRNTTSFGLQLVNTLAEQLEGTIELTCDRGTTFTVRFPNQEP
jgi:two-component sensor histidine kinase